MEKRNKARRYTISPMRIYNAESGELTGRVENISTDGIKMISTCSLEPGRTYKFRMHLPDSLPDRDKIVFRARAVWCRNEDPFGFHDVGLQFVELSDRDRDIIAHPLSDFLLQDR